MANVTLRPQDIQDEVQSYNMPEVKRGMPVVWYPQGQIGSIWKMALVEKAQSGRSNVTLFVGGTHVPIRDAVPHVSDPRLKLGPDHREMGAWDYTEEYLDNQKKLEEFEKRLTALEKGSKPPRSQAK